MKCKYGVTKIKSCKSKAVVICHCGKPLCLWHLKYSHFHKQKLRYKKI